MKSKKANSRSYTMTTRAEQVAQNERNIMDATAALWYELPYHEITLERIAEQAGVTVRTILRKFGTKEQLFETCIEHDTGNTIQPREQAPSGDIPALLEILLGEYEKMGDANIRTLAIEEEISIAQKLLKKGRGYHREWCARVFAPFLPEPTDAAYEVRLLSFIAATDIYLWKLLRRDLQKSYEETFAVFEQLLQKLI